MFVLTVITKRVINSVTTLFKDSFKTVKTQDHMKNSSEMTMMETRGENYFRLKLTNPTVF